MSCFVCGYEIDSHSSYIKCNICSHICHFECLDHENILTCPHCKNVYNPITIIEHMNMKDFKSWIHEFTNKRVEETNSKLALAKKLSKSYVDEYAKFSKQSFRICCDLRETLEMFSVDYDIKNTIDHLFELNTRINELKHELDQKDIDRLDKWINSIQSNITVNDATSLYPSRSILEKEYIEVAYESILINRSIKENYKYIIPGFKTDVNKLDILSYALNKSIIVYFDIPVYVYPDEVGLKKIFEIKLIFESNFKDFFDFIHDTPSFISNALLKSRCNVDTMPRELFNRIGYKLAEFDFSNKSNAINVCERCGGRIEDNYKCAKCRAEYCSNCMMPKHNNECRKEDVESWKTIRKTTRPCPICGTRIEKISGCNDMFCTNCHVGFDWQTNSIKEGAFHNPERNKWLKETKQNNTTLSSVLREFPLDDQLSFFKEIMRTFKRKFPAVFDYITFIDDVLSARPKILQELLPKRLFEGMYGETYDFEEGDVPMNVFYNELSWFLTELMIKVGSFAESEYTNMKEVYEQLALIYQFIINSITAFSVISEEIDNPLLSVLESLQIMTSQTLHELVKNGSINDLNLKYTEDDSTTRSIETLIRMRNLKGNSIFKK